MIRCDGVDGSVRQALPERFDVRLAPEGRVGFQMGIERGQRFIGQRQVVRTDIGGHVDAPLLSRSNETGRHGRAGLGDVDPPARPLRQHEVPCHDGFFRDGGYALQAQPCCVASFVHDAAGGERRVFAVYDDRQVEHPAVFEGAPQDGWIPDGPVRIGQRHGAGLGQFAYFGQAFSRSPGRECGNGIDLRRRSGCPGPNESHGGRVVDDRIGIRHTRHAGDAARDGGARPAFEVFPVFVSGFAEVDVHIDQAGQDELTGRVDDGGALRIAVRGPIDDPALADPEIALFVTAGSGIDDASVADLRDSRASGCIRSVRPHRARLRR